MPHGHIKSHQATLTLEQLHAELGGKIIDNKTEAKRLAQCMKHVEAVLKMLNANYSVRNIAIRRGKPNRWYKRGTVYRSALELLRRLGEPLTARQIAIRLLQDRGAIDPAPTFIRQFASSIQASMRNHQGDTVER